MSKPRVRKSKVTKTLESLAGDMRLPITDDDRRQLEKAVKKLQKMDGWNADINSLLRERELMKQMLRQDTHDIAKLTQAIADADPMFKMAEKSMRNALEVVIDVRTDMERFVDDNANAKRWFDQLGSLIEAVQP